MLHIAKRSVTKLIARTRAKHIVKQGLYNEVDTAAVIEIANQFEDHMYNKYKQIHHACIRNAERVIRLGLTESKGLRILDIGCGFGYFMHAANQCGHSTMGLDRSDPFFNAVTPLFGVERVLHQIEAGEPLPDIPGGPFDLITAFATCFDHAGIEGQWGQKEWEFFLQDLVRFMAPNCRIYIKFNQYVGGGAKSGTHCQPVPDDLMDYFHQLGATFEKRAMDIPNIQAALQRTDRNL
jgi:SAM-dependent methyltransferase